jgi:hypothetical protein
MRTPLLEGRELQWDDRPPGEGSNKAAGVAIVNQTFARTYFGGASPVGRQVIVHSSRAPMEIVGVVADAVYFNVKEEPHPAVFVPLDENDSRTVLVRTASASPDLPALLRRDVPRLHPGMVVREAIPFDAIVTQQMIRERLLAVLSAFFAGLALILAALGLYGVLNYSVSRERRQIGLRLALGARPSHVIGFLGASLLAVVCVGAVVGVAGGLAFGRTVNTVLFQVEPTSPMVLLAPLVALGIVAMLAGLAPALRAIRIDPAESLKAER